MFKRILGAGLGWSLGGPIGGIIGWWLAGKLDQASPRAVPGGHQKTTNRDFIFSMLILSFKVMKADSKITAHEIEFVKKFLLNHFPLEEVREMMLFLKDLENKNYSLQEVCLQIDNQMILEEKNQLLHFLFGLSKADGIIHDQEIEVITKIAVLIRIPSNVFQSMKNMYVQSQDALSHAYHILGVLKSATDEEIKKSFREISLQHHPDKVAHLGENIRKAAEEKFKVINNAYQKIKKFRNF
jgi:DnaJ like chaperone protein